MKRKIYNQLVEWKKQNGKTALLIEGARRVGKSYIVKEFAKENYKSYILIDFAFVTDEVKNLFYDYASNLDMLFMYLQEFYNVTLYERDTLFIFDEVQFCPRARSLIKHLVADGRYDYIETGSLISIHKNVKDILIPSEERKITLYPMDFEEFLWAKGYSEAHIKDMLKHMKTGIPFSETEMSVYKKLFLEYCVLGGMPAVVNLYIETNTFSGTLELQKQIQLDYEEDIRKYAEGLDQTKIVSVYRNVPVQLAKENKKFFFGQIKKGARSSEFEVAIQWLLDCGLIYKVNRVNEPHMPLKAYQSMNAYKLFMMDVGLLSALSELPAEAILEGNDIFVEFKGALTEQYVLQQMISDTPYTPYYYGTDKGTFEQDFLIQKERNIVPIEVKAEGNLRSQSLKAYCEKFHPNMAVRLSALKYKEQDWMINLPLYAVCNL